MRPNIVRAFTGGFLGVFTLTILLYYAGPPAGVHFDIAGGLAHILGSLWGVGMVAHFVLGAIVFPLIYSYWMFRMLPGSPVIKGIEWGIILWILMEVVFMPIVGDGIFNSRAGNLNLVIGGCILNVVYGALQGLIAGPATQVGILLEVPRNRAA